METVAGLLFIVAFSILGVMAVFWFRQISKLFSYLRENHPAEYKAMGEPTLFMNNTPKNNLAFLRFIQSNRPIDLGDKRLAMWCSFLKRFLYTYIALFFGLVVVLVGLPV